jgi:hypothetical protein
LLLLTQDKKTHDFNWQANTFHYLWSTGLFLN